MSTVPPACIGSHGNPDAALCQSFSSQGLSRKHFSPCGRHSRRREGTTQRGCLDNVVDCPTGKSLGQNGGLRHVGFIQTFGFMRFINILSPPKSKGMNSYNRFLPGGMPGSERLLLRDCLEKVHRDIVTCWNFKGEVLDSKEFAYLMLRLSQDVQTEPGAYHSKIDMISQFVALLTPASPHIQSLESALGFTPDFVQWLSTAGLENTSWSQQFLMTYTADLISVLRILFDTTPTPTWDGVRGAYGAYEQSGSRQNLHDRILSTTARGEHVLTKGDMNGVFRGLFAT
ncbi:hypothetical protein EDB83DRAFT_304404 [Lactarius deliciosus]|nr:hypothetical protein EDB83DRAFT_304404 [Lactarius deliciosus]